MHISRKYLPCHLLKSRYIPSIFPYLSFKMQIRVHNVEQSPDTAAPHSPLSPSFTTISSILTDEDITINNNIGQVPPVHHRAYKSPHLPLYKAMHWFRWTFISHWGIQWSIHFDFVTLTGPGQAVLRLGCSALYASLRTSIWLSSPYLLFLLLVILKMLLRKHLSP